MNIYLLPIMAINSWVSLIIAILFGVMGTISMKLFHHHRYRMRFLVYLTLFYAISFVALTLAIHQLDLSIVYAVWSGVGTALVATIGVLYFGESISLRKLIFLFLIIIGVIGLHLSDSLS